MEIFMATMYLLALLYSLFCFSKWVFHKTHQCCYMLHYECYKPDDDEDRKLNSETCAKIVMRNKNLGLKEFRFMLQTVVSSGLGEHSYAPQNVIAGRENSPTLSDSYSEIDDLMFSTLDKLFAKTGISPSQIDILVVNVSLFSPSPSLASRVINRYKMRDDVKSFNLSGMGCSASLISVDLVQHLFKLYRNSFAIVVSTESLSANWYCGNDKSMMLSNCLFRSGGCSILLSNNKSFKNRALFNLIKLARTHLGSNDEAHNCCKQVDDDLGYDGFRLTKYLTKAAAQSLRLTLTVLAPKVLPTWELLRYVFVSFFCRHMNKNKFQKEQNNKWTSINIKTGIEHFCIHPGGRAVIDGVGEGLGLSGYDLEPARMALSRFGNTSAGGLWYVLGYMEAKKRLKKGDRILMVSFGAGFKCNTCVWEVMKDLEDENVWKDELPCVSLSSSINPFTEKFGWINDQSLPEDMKLVLS